MTMSSTETDAPWVLCPDSNLPYMEAVRAVAATHGETLADLRVPEKDPLSPIVAQIVDWTASFLRTAVLERSAGGWGDSDLDADFTILGDQTALSCDLLFAATVQASVKFDVMARVGAAVRCNYGLSRGALSFVARCLEDGLLDGDEVGHPDFVTAYTVHQRFVDADLRNRFAAAAASGQYDD